MEVSSQRILDTGNTILVDRPIVTVPRNTFNLSHDSKFSCEIGQLVPATYLECMPGDIWHIEAECLLRLQALISPVMQRINLRAEWFFVPYRILWPNWENFISPPNPNFVAPVIPNLPANAVTVADGTLLDYFGIPTGQGNPFMNALPLAAYQKIIMNWYTDEDLASGSQNPTFTPDGTPLSDGNNIANLSYLTLLGTRNRDRDYLTSAKPWAQKGPSVVIPALSASLALSSDGTEPTFTRSDGTTIPTATAVQSQTAGTIVPLQFSGDTSPLLYSNPGLHITQAQFAASAGTIDQLRQAEALQKFLEADARGGTRYIELLENHFGVTSSDARLQRAEYLGSSIQPIVISEVLNTTGTSTAPQGQMAGHGVAAHRTNGPIHYHCEEHGIIICIASVLPTNGYFQGVDRMWNRQTRFDWPWPEFAMLGEQAILNQEVFYTYGASANTQTFGYVPQYAEWRTKLNRIAGTFRDSLMFWHLATDWSSLPTLGNGFISSDYGINNYNRIFATLDATGHILEHWFVLAKVERKLPRYVRPSI